MTETQQPGMVTMERGITEGDIIAEERAALAFTLGNIASALYDFDAMGVDPLTGTIELFHNRRHWRLALERVPDDGRPSWERIADVDHNIKVALEKKLTS